MELSLCRLKLLPKVAKKFDKKIGSHGLVTTMRRVLEKTGTKFEVVGKTKKIEKILKSDPVIVLGNHPNESDLLAMVAAMEPREDLFIIGNALLRKISPYLDKQLLPVYLPHDRHGKIDLIKMKIVRKIHSIPIFDEEERRRLNRETIATASDKVNQGGLVAMFPGAGGKNNEWFSGVGYLVNGIKKPGVKVIMVYIENTSEWDYLRFVPWISIFLKTIRVIFFEPVEIGSLNSKEPKKIAQELHDIFWSRVAKITT